jgi:2'-5' RNA ligase
MRAFVGIPLSPEIRSALIVAGRALASEDASWREQKWVAEENLHITLKFLGDLSPQAADDLAAALAQSLLGAEPIPISLAEVSAVPTPRRARMLWGTFDDRTEALTSLARVVDRLAADAGVEPDTRPYTPHATLVRARRPQGVTGAALAAANDAWRSYLGKEPFMSVRQATVYESTLTPSGPIYSTHASVDIGPGD